MKDLKNNMDLVKSIDPGAKTSTATGASVDLKGFNGAMALVYPGTITDGTHTPKLQDSPDNSTWTDVAAADLEGSFAAIASAVIQRVGYKGNRRYVRVVSTVSGATTGGIYGAGIVRGLPETAPVA